MLNNWFNRTKREPQTTRKNFRIGMWVSTLQNEVGVLYKVDDMCVVHLVDSNTGTTRAEVVCPIAGLRQCTWHEIPECRRGITKAQAEAIGYGS